MIPYGEGVVELDIGCPYFTLEPRSTEALDERTVIMGAFSNPIGKPRLSSYDLKDKRVCVVVPDNTRAWQRPWVYLPYVLDELAKAGATDILLLCALGSHRRMSDEETRTLLGEDIYGKYEFHQHDCENDPCLHVGTTSRGTPVRVSKFLLERDFVVLTGGIVYHDLAGAGGGRKAVLPGVCAYETIMRNHALALDAHGVHPDVKQGSLSANPVSLDMEEAARLVLIDYLFNVIADGGRIAAAFAGDYEEAHRAGQAVLADRFAVPIPHKFDLVIASAGGYPCDIDFYQSTKALSNAAPAVKDGGTVVLFCENREGLGHPDMALLYERCANLKEMEAELRKAFTITKFFAYLAVRDAARFKLILVTGMPDPLLQKHGVEFWTVDEAKENLTKAQDGSVCLMTNAAKTLPVIKREEA